MIDKLIDILCKLIAISALVVLFIYIVSCEQSKVEYVVNPVAMQKLVDKHRQMGIWDLSPERKRQSKLVFKYDDSVGPLE